MTVEPTNGLHSIAEKFVRLLAISHRFNSEKNFDELLEIITMEATKLVDAERAATFLLDRASGELWAKTAVGTSETLRFDARLGIAGAVIISGHNIVVEDAYQSPLFNPSMDSVTGFLTRNILCVPLRNGRREIIGVFQVLNKTGGKFTSEDEQLVEALALHAGVALENAKAISEMEIRQIELTAENERLRIEIEERFTTRSIHGGSPRIAEIRALLERVALSSVSVLITGENGTGKEGSARALHFMSPRRAKPFVAVNCAALPETLVESELFGIEKGVASGVDRRIGRVQSADGGTLFLDEIADLNLTAQAKLLRVLQEREVEWLGSRKPVPVDIRLVAATNKDLKEEISKGRFRQDLFYRLNVVHIHMPPLREIRSDVPVLALHFLRKQARDSGRQLTGFSPDAMEALASYSWPGNIRELENEVKRAGVLAMHSQIEARDLSEAVHEQGFHDTSDEPPREGHTKQTIKERVITLEIQMIRDAMTRTGGKKQQAAEMLGLSSQGLLNKLKRYNF